MGVVKYAFLNHLQVVIYHPCFWVSREFHWLLFQKHRGRLSVTFCYYLLEQQLWIVVWKKKEWVKKFKTWREICFLSIWSLVQNVSHKCCRKQYGKYGNWEKTRKNRLEWRGENSVLPPVILLCNKLFV